MTLNRGGPFSLKISGRRWSLQPENRHDAHSGAQDQSIASGGIGAPTIASPDGKLGGSRSVAFGFNASVTCFAVSTSRRSPRTANVAVPFATTRPSAPFATIAAQWRSN